MGTEKDNVTKLHRKPSKSVEIEAHPEEVADVDPETLAIMKARLEGVDFDELYDKEDARLIDRRLERQRKLLFEIFNDNIINCFAEGRLKDGVLREVRYASIDLEFIGDQIEGFDIHNLKSVVDFLTTSRGEE